MGCPPGGPEALELEVEEGEEQMDAEDNEVAERYVNLKRDVSWHAGHFIMT